jgi:methyltransferase (TIGR00027 family)
MDEHQESLTSLWMSVVRELDNASESPLLGDSYAGRLLTDEDRAAILPLCVSVLPEARQRQLLALENKTLALKLAVQEWRSAGNVVVRQRYTEDRLREAVARGVLQYVVLGAGMDTFALRRPDYAVGLKVFEIDHPATQQRKRGRLAAAAIPWPADLEYVPADFERMSLAQILRNSSVDPSLPTFVAMLGVGGYLTPAKNLETHMAIALHLGAGTELVSTYLKREKFERRKNPPMLAAFARAGEIFDSGFLPAEMAEMMKAAGFAVLEDRSVSDVGREDYPEFARRWPNRSANRIVHGRVPAKSATAA